MITDIMPVITGELSSIQDTIIGELTSLYYIEAELTMLSTEYYEGDYVVIPKMEQQKLATKDKTIRDDVTVEEIPVYQTENISGGFTVIIGG